MFTIFPCRFLALALILQYYKIYGINFNFKVLGSFLLLPFYSNFSQISPRQLNLTAPFQTYLFSSSKYSSSWTKNQYVGKLFLVTFCLHYSLMCAKFDRVVVLRQSLGERGKLDLVVWVKMKAPPATACLASKAVLSVKTTLPAWRWRTAPFAWRCSPSSVSAC